MGTGPRRAYLQALGEGAEEHQVRQAPQPPHGGRRAGARARLRSPSAPRAGPQRPRSRRPPRLREGARLRGRPEGGGTAGAREEEGGEGTRGRGEGERGTEEGARREEVRGWRGGNYGGAQRGAAIQGRGDGGAHGPAPPLLVRPSAPPAPVRTGRAPPRPGAVVAGPSHAGPSRRGSEQGQEKESGGLRRTTGLGSRGTEARGRGRVGERSGDAAHADPPAWRGDGLVETFSRFFHFLKDCSRVHLSCRAARHCLPARRGHFRMRIRPFPRPRPLSSRRRAARALCGRLRGT